MYSQKVACFPYQRIQPNAIHCHNLQVMIPSQPSLHLSHPLRATDSKTHLLKMGCSELGKQRMGKLAVGRGRAKIQTGHLVVSLQLCVQPPKTPVSPHRHTVASKTFCYRSKLLNEASSLKYPQSLVCVCSSTFTFSFPSDSAPAHTGLGQPSL